VQTAHARDPEQQRAETQQAAEGEPKGALRKSVRKSDPNGNGHNAAESKTDSTFPIHFAGVRIRWDRNDDCRKDQREASGLCVHLREPKQQGQRGDCKARATDTKESRTKAADSADDAIKAGMQSRDPRAFGKRVTREFGF
jgi:hypothetical protein